VGSGSRARPRLLKRKLRAIRATLELSQTDLGIKLGHEKAVARNYVSGYERGTREPTLPVLLAYARLIGISTDVLIDDAMDWPSARPRRSGKK